MSERLSEEFFAADNSCDIDIAAGPGGWLAVYRSIPSVDDQHLEDFSRYTVSFKPGTNEDAWSGDFSEALRSLYLARSTEEGIEKIHLTTAERVTIPSLADGNRPIAVWGERNSETWQVKLWDQSGIESVYSTPNALRTPVACVDVEGTLWVAWEQTHPEGHKVSLMNSRESEPSWSSPGTSPAIGAGAEGDVWLAWEVTEGGRTDIWLKDGGFRGEPIKVPSDSSVNLNPDLAVADDGTILVVWESSPGWGRDHRFGLNREIRVARYEPASGSFSEIDGCDGGVIPVPKVAFQDFCRQNVVPITPKILASGMGLICTFRMFHPRGSKSFGWDIVETHLVEGLWSEPVAIGNGSGYPDSGYGICLWNDLLLTAAHRCDHLPQLTYAEEEGSERRPTQRARNHRVYLTSSPAFEPVGPRAPVVSRHRAEFVQEKGFDDPISQPKLRVPGQRRKLVWGDLHVHSTASKCMSANDGTPMDNIRWQRDVAFSGVITLTEHVEYMADQEFIRNADLIEGESCESCVVLYGVEWAKSPAHHTNFFCVSREIYDSLRSVLLKESYLMDVFRRVKNEFPPNSVVAIRHFHGESSDEFGVHGPRVTDTYDPAVEWAMEAVQTRLDAMRGTQEGEHQDFPANFLLDGARIGLVGGSDHCRDSKRKFCFTGFWVDELTPEAIFRAIRNRHTTAAASGKIALWMETQDGETAMGGEGETEPPVNLRISFAAGKPLKSLQIWKDGHLIDLDPPEGESGTVDFVDHEMSGIHCYLVRAESESKFDGIDVVAYSSPIWLEVR